MANYDVDADVAADLAHEAKSTEPSAAKETPQEAIAAAVALAEANNPTKGRVADLDKYGMAGGAMLAAAAARRFVMPKGSVYDSKEYVPPGAAAGQAAQAAETASAQQAQSFTDHAAKQQQLQQLHADALAAQEAATAEKAKAALTRSAASSSGSTGLPQIGSTTPLAGSTGLNYGTVHGGTTAESASKTASQMQSHLPVMAEANNAAVRLGQPDMRVTPNSALVLGPEGRASVDATARGAANETARASDALAKMRATAQMRYEAAEAAAKNAADAARKTAANIAEHAKNAPLGFGAPQSAVSSAANSVNAFRPPTAPSAMSRLTDGAQALGNLGGNAGRFVVKHAGPAALPFNALDAKQQYDQGNYVRALMSSLAAAGNIGQASGFPPAMALGTAAQVPATAMMGYDYLSPLAQAAWAKYNQPTQASPQR